MLILVPRNVPRVIEEHNAQLWAEMTTITVSLGARTTFG